MWLLIRSSQVPSNLAEGCGRNGIPEMGRFLQFALGSASELEYQLLLAHDLGLIEAEDHELFSENTREIKKMLTALLQKLTTDN